MRKPTVFVVHCIDTEGPLYESVEESFKRMEVIFGIRDIEPTKANLKKLQNKEIPLGGIEEQVARVFAPELLAYIDNYHKLDDMLERIGSESFRYAYPDSCGGGWIYNWHCVDHLNYTVNPRRKDIGMHNIFDYYSSFIRNTQAPDAIHWHYHPSHYRGVSHLSSTSYLRDTKFFDILAHRIIERQWFPSVNRAGYHTERPDSHWLLEQWIPFDISNQAFETKDEQPDVSGGRFGDWRRAPGDWSIYRPHHDDYQIPGNCRRHIARCLNVGTRFRCIDRAEVEKAFMYAAKNGYALMAFTDHDFRDMTNDVLQIQELLKQVSPHFPGVDFRYMEAREAMNYCIFGDFKTPVENILSVSFSKNASGKPVMQARSSEPTFGPQPFLALQMKDGQFLHDNLDFQEHFRHWTYTFDEHSFEWERVLKIGLGTNDRRGFPHVLVMDAKDIII